MIIVLSIATALTAVYIVRLIAAHLFMTKRRYVYYRVTPLEHNDIDYIATQHFITALHRLGKRRTLVERVLGLQNVYSLEIESSKIDGLVYQIRVPDVQADNLLRLLSSYSQNAKSIESFTKESNGRMTSKAFEFRQIKHFAFPLAIKQIPSLSDPLGYLTTSMTQLHAGERMIYSIVLSPIDKKLSSRKIQKIINKILSPSAVSAININTTGSFVEVAHAFSNFLLDVISGLFNGLNANDNSSNSQLEPNPTNKNISPQDEELRSDIENKLREPLFTASIRCIVTGDKKSIRKRLISFESALSIFGQSKEQNLIRRRILLQRILLRRSIRRMPSKLHSNVLSSSELACLYHFPNSKSARTENVIKTLSKDLPAPVTLKQEAGLDVYLGENRYQGSTTLIGLSKAERERHVYIVGGTGNGKTTMLLYSILQDIKNGKGIAVIDPHGDLAETILESIPEDRIKDVVYLNPDDLEYPIGINLIEMDKTLTGDDLIRQKDIITESTVSVMRKIFSEDDSGGHRVEYILRNAIHTALTIEGSTIFTIFKLLTDDTYRRKVVWKLEDEDLKNFWRNELGKAGEFQRVKMSAGITSKIGRFLFSGSAKKVLGQEQSTIDFSDIINSKKILICNFSKGLIGEDTSVLFSTTVLAKIQIATLKRARMKYAKRTPFYLYADEFQHFATISFLQLLSEARKFKLFLTMAEQSTAQQDHLRFVDIILANVGTVICFRSGSPADEKMLLPLFSPFVAKGEIANLPTYSFYARLGAVHSQEPMSGVTIKPEENGSVEIAERVKISSRELYGYKEEDIEIIPIISNTPVYQVPKLQ
ncbi:MAG: type IV secretion system DNA-binding domain-containing protein [Candidatus Saccharibacteria bacterium]|nr:type IV secretion system DNA-binding domain-containing protein [Candidatus Saccharibacteria bacterium]